MPASRRHCREMLTRMATLQCPASPSSADDVRRCATQETTDVEEEDDAYSELVAQLQSKVPGPTARAFQVRLVGRWAEQSAAARSGDESRSAARRAEVPHTPLAARSCTFGLADAAG